ncbi:phosphotransferase [Sulfitobacter sp. D35]|uniref:aminoglycoside phosphotransferase family protein n=1 Tax=Sulfitobacter sp. D35 TaxID=3083252 RepID=UPI00296FC770|nr:phosphotransferase [Sulfitobacter sp. D35]MDW4498092.1 phosphotransferase [Sulfitobacter sp. D35]
MTARADLARDFLDRAGWGDARRTLLAGDASQRRYDRLKRGSKARAVLMDADPARGEDTRPFITIAEHLRGIGLSAPEILASDPAHGFLLLEDLGDDVFARLVTNAPELETSLYDAAIDVLPVLQDHAAPALSRLDAATCADLAAAIFEWYHTGSEAETSALAAEFRERFENLCQPLDTVAPVLMLRDYHAENLIWLPERAGVARVGLLDFQDAMLAHPAYDLVSILQDARRDVPPALETHSLDRFLAATGHDRAAFGEAYATLGLQRQLRILGVFARLSRRDGKARYIDFVPRVWALAQRNLAHPALSGIASFLADTLPPPTPDHLARLRQTCQTAPTP